MGSGIGRIVTVATVLVTTAACAASAQSGGAAPPCSEVPSSHAHHTAAPPPPPAPLRDGESFHTVGLERAYQPVPPAAGTDEYRCFLVDPKLTASSFIMGSQFLPQNAEIVHHSIMYAVAPAKVADAKAVDAKSDGDGWQCFGGAGLSEGFSDFGGGGRSGVTYIGGWAPGGKEALLGELAGYPLEAGSQIVLQMHYNLLSTKGKPGPTDQSTVRLRLMPGTATVKPLRALRMPVPVELPCTSAETGHLCDREKALKDLVRRTGTQARDMVNGLNFLCNKGATPVPGDTQHCDVPINAPTLVYAAAPHMHLLGRSMTIELNPGTPGARMLLDQPAFNFDDQSGQVFPQPVRLNKGDTVRVTCTHDASVRSRLPQLKELQPRYVVWGDGTADEMCLATLTATNQI
ncbi:MAG TPA: monooxygenase [Micromonosporaceae bacterium]|nr:monooxygenase [Micromonosporaceae bacterium]